MKEKNINICHLIFLYFLFDKNFYSIQYHTIPEMSSIKKKLMKTLFISLTQGLIYNKKLFILSTINN